MPASTPQNASQTTNDDAIRARRCELQYNRIEKHSKINQSLTGKSIDRSQTVINAQIQVDFPIDDCHVYTYQNLDKDYDVTDFESKIAMRLILAKIRQIILIIGLI